MTASPSNDRSRRQKNLRTLWVQCGSKFLTLAGPSQPHPASAAVMSHAEDLVAWKAVCRAPMADALETR